MRRRNEVYIVTAARLQLEHDRGEAFVSYLVFDLFLMRLRDLIVLTIDAAQVAIAEKDVSRASGANQAGLFTKVRGVGGHNWQPAGITGSDFILETIVQAVARADRAAFE